MKWLRRMIRMAEQVDDLKSQLFAFLGSDAQQFPRLGGSALSRQQARELLQELIPAVIEVRGVCRITPAAVVAAPHVSFDNWSEYFCNRIARRLRIGWVVAKNYRDQHSLTIPVSIGRHVHVNRPTESEGPGRPEMETERARDVFEAYLAAIREASGRAALPADVLIEVHSHHRTSELEIASAGLTEGAARQLAIHYDECRQRHPNLPELRIAPLHELTLAANAARRHGSIRTDVARVALHVEVPREARQSDETRRTMCHALCKISEYLLRSDR